MWNNTLTDLMLGCYIMMQSWAETNIPDNSSQVLSGIFLSILNMLAITAKLLFHQSPTRHNDYTVTTWGNWQCTTIFRAISRTTGLIPGLPQFISNMMNPNSAMKIWNCKYFESAGSATHLHTHDFATSFGFLFIRRGTEKNNQKKNAWTFDLLHGRN